MPGGFRLADGERRLKVADAKISDRKQQVHHPEPGLVGERFVHPRESCNHGLHILGYPARFPFQADFCAEKAIDD